MVRGRIVDVLGGAVEQVQEVVLQAAWVIQESGDGLGEVDCHCYCMLL